MDIKINNHTVIVFDLDDTLYNEIDYLKSAYITIAKELEPILWQQLFTYMFSLFRNKLDVFEYVSLTYRTSKQELINKYHNHIPDIQVFEGVLSVFKEIKKRKGKIAIITDGRKVTQMNKISALEINSFIDYIVISEEIGTEKPNEKNYKIIEEKFNRSSYFYIADNIKKDFITPKLLGWKTIALMDYGLNIHSNSHLYLKQEYLPHNYISSFSELKIR